MKIIDLHCDTLYKFLERGNYSFSKNDGHITEKALIDGGYLAECFAIYTPTNICGYIALKFLKEQYNRFLEIINSADSVYFAKNAKKIQNNKISAFLTVENAEFLNNDIENLKLAENFGVKILGLIHNGENCLGFPHSQNPNLDNLPLKKFGREVVDALNQTDILVDVSHLNFKGFCDVAEISKKPFCATHSACRDLVNHSRNLYDIQIKKIAKSGGIVGIPFYSKFLNGTNKTEISDVLRHLEHLINVGGEDIAAIGTDFDGMECDLFIKTASEMQILADALNRKFGFSVAEKICYKNALRILT